MLRIKCFCKTGLLSVLLLLSCLMVNGKVRPASLFADGMVLQQKSNAHIWGWADPGKKITVTGSWDGKTYNCQSKDDGRWDLSVKTPAADGKSYELILSDGDSLIIRNVVMGEVWLASGQSNMEMPLRGWPKFPLAGASRFIKEAEKYKDKLRFVQVPHNPSLKPADQIELKWTACDSVTAKDFSAAGYFFGCMLSEQLKCPIGIICSTFGGTHVEAWSPKELLLTYPDINLRPDYLEMLIPSAQPMVMYNGMIHPLVGYTLKGFIWYQGEADVSAYDKYALRFSNMVKAWRAAWNDAKLPFLFVELAPYRYTGLARNRAPRLREAQWAVADEMSDVSLICTNDLVSPDEAGNVHPSNKLDVGKRLSWLALDKVYHRNGFPTGYPRFQKMKTKGKSVTLSFLNAEDGFVPVDNVAGFEICGEDNIYYPAAAVFEGCNIVVSSDKVARPKAVHYAYKDFLIGNVKSRKGLPLVPFSTAR